MPLEVLLNWGTLGVGVSFNMSRAERKWGTVPEVEVPGTLGAIPVALNLVRPEKCNLVVLVDLLEVGVLPKTMGGLLVKLRAGALLPRLGCSISC